LSYVEKNLIPGERVLYQTGRHWIVLVVPFVLGTFFALIGVLPLIGSFVKKDGTLAGVALGFLLFAAALFGLAVLSRNAVEMAVTNKRVLIKSGLLSRRTFELLLTKVESIGVEEGVLGRILGYGAVVVRGTGGTPEPFTVIAHPLEFRRQVQQQIEMRERGAQQVLVPVS
jgi:uncharacterized membrane protein YdbT with pleckstrin-like domain